jgi:pimeloyl-ACP methyl ester carboxylesterase
VRVDEHTIELASGPLHYRTAAWAGADSQGVTPVYLHGLPTSSEDWAELLAITGGVAPDLLGFGQSAKGGHLEYTVDSLADFTRTLIDHLALERVALIGHQWGAVVALQLAASQPKLIDRLALISPLPLTQDHRWGRLARALRRPVQGELVMGATTKTVLARQLRRGGDWSNDQLNAVWRDFDQGTQRAILRLYRATDPAALAALAPLETRSLVILGESDPWTRSEPTQQLVNLLLPRATLTTITGAGHWPWRTSAQTVDLRAEFLR